MATGKLDAGILLFICLVALPASGQSAQLLPDAPNPGSLPVRTTHTDRPSASKWHGVVDLGEAPPPLSWQDKMLFWLHEEISPTSWLSTVLSSGFEQWTDDDPKYGTDSAAFGQRFGAAVLREASMRFFSDSLLPALTHEDPRYFRKAHGGVVKRGLYAAEQVFVVRRDNGIQGANYSDILGHLAASALTPTYYPAPSANGRVVATTWAISLAGEAGDNLLAEFWPDVRDVILHRHRRETRQSMDHRAP